MAPARPRATETPQASQGPQAPEAHSARYHNRSAKARPIVLRPVSKRSVPERAGELFRLARLLAHSPLHANAAKWDEQLAHLVARHLHNGRDAVLLESLEQADAAGDAHTGGELGFQIEHGAERQVMGVLADGRGCEARLFAIPVILPDVRRVLHGHLPGHALTQELAASLRQHDLVAPEQCLNLASYLFHPDELDGLAPSEVYRLCQQLALAERGNTPCGAGWPEVPHTTRGPAAGLRYLVGVVAGPAVPGSLLEPSSEGAEDDEAHGALQNPARDASPQMAQWRTHAAHMLREVYYPRSGMYGRGLAVQVYPVGSFFEARRIGETIYKGMGTLSALLSVLQQTGIAPAKASAVVAPFIMEDDTVSVIASLASRLDGSLLGTADYPVSAYEQLDDVLSEVRAMLVSQGVAAVAVSDTLVPVQRCDCCGEPMALVPGTAQGLHAALRPEGAWLH